MYMKFWIILSVILVIDGSDKNVPSFVKLPPPIQYYKPTNPQSLELICQVWPSSAKIQFATTSEQFYRPGGLMGQDRSPTSNAGSSINFHFLDKNLGNLKRPGHLVFNNVAMLDGIQEENIHCLAGTDFGTIISRPFRVIKAVMSSFGGRVGVKPKKNVNLLKILPGNVVPIDCILPESHPPAIVTFLRDNKPIRLTSNMTIIRWTDQKRATLLMKPMIKQFEGLYTCQAKNPVTNAIKTSHRITQIKMKAPTSNVNFTFIILPSGRSFQVPQYIKAKVGGNITIFCVMSGYPTPNVRIESMLNMLKEDRRSRFKFDSKFGSLTITNLRKSDAENYACRSDVKVAYVTLKIIEPLRILSAPKDVIVNKMGTTVKFSCESSKPAASTNWFFNGRPLTTPKDTSYTINEVSPINFGIYQCVVQDTNEWVSASATLSYKTSNLITRPKVAYSTAIQPGGSTSLMSSATLIDTLGTYVSRLNVRKLGDNLAVLITWKLKNAASIFGRFNYFKMEFRQYCLQRLYSGSSNVLFIPNNTRKSYMYVTRKHLKPRCKYQFRVVCVLDRKHIVSPWSSPPTSFFNMAPLKPEIKVLPLSDTSVKLSWTYYDISNNWPMTHWKILYRLVPRPKNVSFNLKVVAQPIKKIEITNLLPNTKYEFVVYGEYRMPNRSTTLFSDSVQVTTLNSGSPSSTSSPGKMSSFKKFFVALWKSIKSNKVIYGGLLAVVAVLLLVMVLLCLLCFCRRRSRYRCKQNSAGALGNYKTYQVPTSNHYDTTLQHPTNEKHDSRLLENGGSVGGGNGGAPPPPPPISRNGTSSGVMHVGGSLDRRALLANNTHGSDMSGRQQQQYMSPPPPHQQMMSPYEMQMMMQARRAGSIQALETASMVTDLASHPNSSQHHFSTLQQYPRSGGGYMAPPPHHQHQQPQQHQIQHNNPRSSQLMMDPDTQSMSASQLYLYHQQIQPGYYNQGGPATNRAVSPQLTQLMMMQQQQQQAHGPVPPPLPPTQHFRRSTSSQLETPVALVNMPNSLSAYGSAGPGGYGMHHPQQIDDRISIQDGPARSLSPQQQYYQQQQQMDMYAAHHQFQQGSMSMGRQYPMGGGPVHHPIDPDYIGHYHHQQQQQQQHTLNSLPETGALDQTPNAGLPQPPAPQSKSHHHRRKTRQRQNNGSSQNNAGSQGNLEPGMMTQQMMQQEQDSLDRSHNQMMGSGQLDNSHHNNVTGGAIVTDLDTNNQTLIDNLPRIRDVSEYGIQAPYGSNSITTAVPSNGAVNIASVANNEIKPVPPTKSNLHNNHHGNDSNHTTLTTVANSYTQPPQQQQDYYSSATSSEQSGPNPPPKYMHHSAAMMMQQQQQQQKPPPQNDMYNMYYQHHSDTHC